MLQGSLAKVSKENKSNKKNADTENALNNHPRLLEHTAQTRKTTRNVLCGRSLVNSKRPKPYQTSKTEALSKTAYDRSLVGWQWPSKGNELARSQTYADSAFNETLPKGENDAFGMKEKCLQDQQTSAFDTNVRCLQDHVLIHSTMNTFKVTRVYVINHEATATFPLGCGAVKEESRT